jgi:hypothetical protein
MRKGFLLAGAAAGFVSVFAAPLTGQFLPREILDRPKIENRLEKAEILRIEEIGEGVTRPLRVYLAGGEGTFSGCWKNPSGIRQGFLEGWRFEIAAYRLDNLLGLNMIPPTVERTIEGRKGSFQYWVDSPRSLLDIIDNRLSVPQDMLDNDQKMKYLARAFDSLIANEDRTQQNIRYTSDWRVILIDHSRSFRSSKRFTRQLMYGRNGIMGDKRIRRLPREFVQRLRELDFDGIRGAVGEYLEDKEIEAVLERRTLLLEEIESTIREKGEAAVIY